MDDEGFLCVVDRVTDMIARGGKKLYSTVAAGRGQVPPSAAARTVIGVPDADRGGRVHALVVLKAGPARDVELGEQAVAVDQMVAARSFCGAARDKAAGWHHVRLLGVGQRCQRDQWRGQDGEGVQAGQRGWGVAWIIGALLCRGGEPRR